MKIIVNIFIATFVALGLSACIPTITTIYESPEVFGEVIDAETLKPVAGASLQFVHPKAEAVISDGQGRFALPAISSVQATLLMVGHAMTSYYINAQDSTFSIELAARGTLKMLYLETISPFWVFFDTEQQNISPAEMETDVSFEALQSASLESGALRLCDKAARENAIKVLLTARKVSHSIARENQENPSNKERASLHEQYLESAFEQVYIQWNELYYTCGGEFQDRLNAQSFIKNVKEESKRYI